MNSEKIRSEIEELLLIVASWEQDSAPSVIEQDIALAKIAKLYEGIKFMTCQETETPTEPSAVEEDEAAELTAHVADESIFAIDLDGISLIDPKAEAEDESELKEEPEVEEEPEQEPEIESEVEEEPQTKEEVEEEKITEEEAEEEKEEEPTPIQRSDMLFDIAPIPKKNRSRRRVLMSLYHDDAQAIGEPSIKEKPAAESQPQPQKQEPREQLPFESPVATPTTLVEPNPTSEFVSSSSVIGNSTPPVQTLADTLSRDVETLADRYAEASPKLVGESTIAYNSFDKLGINERYLLARDLFGDDPQLCVEELATIGAFDNYDDAIIYIAENYNWSGESEGAKLLLSVLERKFNIS